MSKKLSAAILFAIFLLSAFSITNFLAPQDIFSNSPIYTDDYAMHLSQCLATKRFMSSDGKCWGYDPFFLAGFPRGALVNVDNKAWEMLFLLCSQFFSEGFSFKLYLLLFLLLYPFFFYAAARNFNLSREVALLSALLAMLFFHLSIAVAFVAWGMLAYVFASCFAIYVFSLFYKLFENFTWRRYLISVFFTTLILLMHILSPLSLLIPVVILYGCCCKQLSPARHFLMVVMAGIVLLANSYWLLPVTKFFHAKATRLDNYEFTLQIQDVFEPLHVYLEQYNSIPYRTNVYFEQLRDKSGSISPEANITFIEVLLNNTFIEALLLLLGLCGFYLWWQKKMFKLLLPFLGGIVFLFIVTYYGSRIDFFVLMQPQRFVIPLNVFLMIPAGVGGLFILQSLCQGKSATALVFMLSLGFVLFIGPVVKPLRLIYKYNIYRLRCEFPAPLEDLLGWLQNHTTRAGRILLEDSEFTSGHQYYGAHFPALFAEQVKREYLCGPRPLYPIRHSFASFTAGELFEKRLQNYSLEELKKYFELYNVQWIVCWFEQSKDFFNQFPEDIVPMKEIDKFTIYEVKNKPSFFLKGSGTAEADYNRIQLSNIIAEDGEIIIKYHWMKYLKTIPALQIERASALDDPVGFIRIKDPPESLLLYNDY